MLMGLMDHWVPSHDAVSRFWKTPFAELRAGLEAICDELDVNNFTFYIKWFSNGIKSALPFLTNHPQAQNVVTDNAWGRDLIDFFHGRDMTVGAMIQCYAFDAGRLPPEGVSDIWKDTCMYNGDARDSEIADPTWSDYLRCSNRCSTKNCACFRDWMPCSWSLRAFGSSLIIRSSCAERSATAIPSGT